MKMRIAALAALLVSAQTASTADPGAANGVRDELMRINHLMQDADRRGDVKVFKRYLAPGYIEVWPNGHVQTRAELLKDFGPTPNAVKESYHEKEIRLQGGPGLAILSMRVDVHLDYSGQTINQKFRVTQTWQRTGGRWQLVAEHNSHISVDPSVAKIDPEVYNSYAGTYQIGKGLLVTIKRAGNRLMIRTPGDKTDTELVPESETTFFVRNSSGREIFKKDDNGQVVEYVFRMSDGNELHGKRVK